MFLTKSKIVLNFLLIFEDKNSDLLGKILNNVSNMSEPIYEFTRI